MSVIDEVMACCDKDLIKGFVDNIQLQGLSADLSAIHQYMMPIIMENRFSIFHPYYKLYLHITYRLLTGKDFAGSLDQTVYGQLEQQLSNQPVVRVLLSDNSIDIWPDVSLIWIYPYLVAAFCGTWKACKHAGGALNIMHRAVKEKKSFMFKTLQNTQFSKLCYAVSLFAGGIVLLQMPLGDSKAGFSLNQYGLKKASQLAKPCKDLYIDPDASVSLHVFVETTKARKYKKKSKQLASVSTVSTEPVQRRHTCTLDEALFDRDDFIFRMALTQLLVTIERYPDISAQQCLAIAVIQKWLEQPQKGTNGRLSQQASPLSQLTV